MNETKQQKIRLSLDVTPELNELLESIASDLHASKADVLRKAIVLMEVAHDAKRKGKHFGVSKSREDLETEIVGL